jgi:hypothetical protein
MNTAKFIAVCAFGLLLGACTTTQGPVGPDAIVVLKSGS